jgi:membrane-bound metal-dependent hydrolase YbcI (DUF457 family)
VDTLTHGVASLALQRAFFPRASWRTVAAIVVAGVIADVDWFTATLGPAAYLQWHRTASHSLTFVAVLAVAAFLAAKIAAKSPELWRGFSWASIAAAALLHLVLDALQTDSVALVWPFSQRRFALDLLANLDLWLIVIFAAAILFPELFRLVSEEIGSRSKAPRGRDGAIAGLVVAALYLGLRFLVHGNTVASLDSHTIAGETPHRAAAFPDSTSPFTWHGVVETQSAIHLVTLHSSGRGVAYASGITTVHKPEPSPMLAAAQASPTVVAFLKFARFPKATVLATAEGYEVGIGDFKDQATDEKGHTIFADIVLDKNSRLVSSELQWQKTYASK